MIPYVQVTRARFGSGIASRARAWGLALLIASFTAGPVAAQIAPFSAIVESQPSAYDQHLIKLTFMGPQKKSTPSLGLHTGSRSFTYSPFVPFYRSSLDYDNDGLSDRTAQVTSDEISAFVSRMLYFPDLTDNGDLTEPFLSVAITKPGGNGDIVWEGLYTESEARRVLGLLENRLRSNPDARAAIVSFKYNCFGL